jgi:hydroxymethylpyrimidine/phosphomethylpyrimidine kinase
MSLPPRNSSTVLSIAGSDSGGGAGVQADLKTFAAHGVHGASVITALTAQNTRGVQAIHVPDPTFLAAQLRAVFEDFDVVAVKLGMLADERVIEVVADALERFAPAHVVLDPVMVATSGARLLESSALEALRARLFPLATLLTPNLPEAELLLGSAIGSALEAEQALTRLLASPLRAVLLKGGHMADGGDTVVDRLGWGSERVAFVHTRLPGKAHGTGCTLAAAVAANLAEGLPLVEACRAAADYVHRALQGAYFPGHGGLAVLDHGAPRAR